LKGQYYFLKIIYIKKIITIKRKEKENRSTAITKSFTCYTKHNTSKGCPAVSPSPSKVTIYTNWRKSFQDTAIISPNIEHANTSN